jgi:hypothetical protein
MRRVAFGLFAACFCVASAGCGLVFSTDCFDGTCSPSKDASPADATTDASLDLNQPDIADASVPDTADAADTAPPSCGSENACVSFKPGANYCGNQGAYTGHGVTGCVYYCSTNNVPCSKWCPQGCDAVNPGTDHCHNEPTPSCN